MSIYLIEDGMIVSQYFTLGPKNKGNLRQMQELQVY
jgi:hypothetical protein